MAYMNLKTKRAISASLMIVAASLALTAPAHAATEIKVSSGPISGGNSMSATGTPAPDVFQFDGSSGGAVTVSSTSTGVVAGTGCVQVNPFAARCFGIVLIEAFGGSGKDTITNNTNARMGVNGGSDNDTLVGGSFRDTLNGGVGNDFANGRGGFDTCSVESFTSCEEITS